MPDDDNDPLLVRPYLGGASAETWPEAAPPAEPGPPPADVTAPIAPVSHAAPAPALWRRPMLVLAVVIALIVAGGTGLIVAWWPEPAPPRALPADVPLPPLPSSAPAVTPGTAPAGPVPVTTAPRTRAPSSPAPTSTSPSTASPSSAPSRTTSPGATTTPARTAPPAALVPPNTSKVGTIRGDGGLCLDLNGGVPFDGNHVQVYDCNSSVAQIWTLATDGTLRVLNMCAFAAGDSTVHIVGCDGRTPAQWRSRDGSLVNVATGGCLTDPSTGTRSGTGVRVAACTGGRDQGWNLP
ncbi:RICIN domain-containing protein [Actinoplanes friuliensis]|uniref:Ricin n=1 Tax=Actinoplanes friuliensis DSM 7358 TaxID=1246995 RepID=U5W0X5_9ACTN|nr:RICIN domain-containing protein [Actinoplanes friuliensis]AGZ42667.1 Ricin [Actinoplanes friuliensis DSM 7358]